MNGRLGTETTNPQVATAATRPPTNAAHATYAVDVAESHTVGRHAVVAAVAPFAPSYIAIEAAADTGPFLRRHRQDPSIHDFHSLCHKEHRRRWSERVHKSQVIRAQFIPQPTCPSISYHIRIQTHSA